MLTEQIGDIHKHLIKETWESVISENPAVEIRVIDMRLNFINLKI